MKITGIKELKAAAARMRAIPDATQRAAYRSVNAVAAKVKTQAVREITAQINLPQSYIRGQISSTQATMNNATAMLRIRRRGVTLARFEAIQLTRAAPRAKGDAFRKIASGRKQAGVSVKVAAKGSRKTLRGAFLLPLRAGRMNGGNGLGIFVRDNRAGPKSDYAGVEGMDMQKYKWRGNIRHLYGPSPDQVFRRWRGEAAPGIKRMLADAFASQFRYELRGRRK